MCQFKVFFMAILALLILSMGNYLESEVINTNQSG